MQSARDRDAMAIVSPRYRYSSPTIALDAKEVDAFHHSTDAKEVDAWLLFKGSSNKKSLFTLKVTLTYTKNYSVIYIFNKI